MLLHWYYAETIIIIYFKIILTFFLKLFRKYYIPVSYMSLNSSDFATEESVTRTD